MAACLASPAVHAGTWSVTYSQNGTVSGTQYNNANNSYQTYSNPLSGSGSGGSVPAMYSMQATVSDTVTATLTWTPATGQTIQTDPPSSAVVVQETASASWALTGTGTSTVAPFTASDGLGDALTTTTSGGQTSGQSSSGVRWLVKAGSSGVVVLDAVAMTAQSPAFSSIAASGYGAAASVSLSVIPYNVTVSLGNTTPDTSGKPNILVGQGCTASLGNFPAALLPYTTYSWTATASGTIFQSWVVTQNLTANPPTSYTTYTDGIGTATNSTAKWYWNDPTTTSELVECRVTVHPPGQAGFVATPKRSVSVQLPGWYANGTGGYMQVNGADPTYNGAISLYAGPAAGQSGGGMMWLANVYSSALFASGTLELIQLVTPNMSYVTYPGVGVPGVTRNDPENGLFGVDTGCPYPWRIYGSYMPPYTPVAYKTQDSPSIELSSGIESAVINDQFNDYLMFQPPGSDVQWVPLGMFNWDTNGNATAPTTHNWADYATQNGSDAAGTVNPTGGAPFTPSNSFPSWARVNVFPSF